MNKLNNITKQWRDAATLIIVARSHKNSYKILMLKRSSKSKFMPNAYVFPGGVTSIKTDFTEEWNDIFKRNNYRTDFDRIFKQKVKPSVYTSNVYPGKLQPELSLRICALRETFEEAGILFLTDDKGKNIVLDDPKHNIGGEYGTLQSWRDKVNEDDTNFLKLFRSLKCSPSILCLFDWSTWLTPTVLTRRFDTMFYLCFVDAITELSSECGNEVVQIDWLSLNEIYNKVQNVKPPQIHEAIRMSRNFELCPNILSLHEWSTWLTPTFHDRRFNTAFYVHFIDNVLSQSVDTHETVHSDWLTPFDALEAHFMKKITLRYPQVYECNRLIRYSSFDELKAFTEIRETLGLETWCAFKITLKDGAVFTYPGDDFHNADPYAESGGMDDTTIKELSNQSKHTNRMEVPSSAPLDIALRNNTEWCGHLPIGSVAMKDLVKK